MLDLSNNKLSEIPSELSDCTKLKEINFKGNKLNDKRLEKMVNNCQTKSILDYLRVKGKGRRGEDGADADSGRGADKGRRQQQRKKKEKVEEEQDEVEELSKMVVRVLHVSDVSDVSDASAALTVRVSAEVKDVRPYLVCCVVRGMNLKPGNALKRFLVAQVGTLTLCHTSDQFIDACPVCRPCVCLFRRSFMMTCAVDGRPPPLQLTICSLSSPHSRTTSKCQPS